jgi:hypothetical protein
MIELLLHFLQAQEDAAILPEQLPDEPAATGQEQAENSDANRDRLRHTSLPRRVTDWAKSLVIDRISDS